ncbi:hypothetical protein CsSME_00002681 [Camellia sinensis var. sinensis]
MAVTKPKGKGSSAPTSQTSNSRLWLYSLLLTFSTVLSH